MLLGSPQRLEDLRALAARCDVVTFDHEQVDLEAIRTLEAEGFAIAPSSTTLEAACSKVTLRQRCGAAGLPSPRHLVVAMGTTSDEVRIALTQFCAEVGTSLIVKPARGGYDGRGVHQIEDIAEAAALVETLSATDDVLCEEVVAMSAELAVIVVRRHDGTATCYPPVVTTQVEGMCREVLVPGAVDADLAARARALALEVASLLEVVGVLAVELFVVGDALVLCEVAARPHNSGHWSIEGATCSQFENHLRAVCGLPLGDPSPTASAIAMVNVVGPSDGSDPLDHLEAALAVPGAHVHLYGKAPRPGRKMGHVTVCGQDPEAVSALAWRCATALGTEVPSELRR